MAATQRFIILPTRGNVGAANVTDKTLGALYRLAGMSGAKRGAVKLGRAARGVRPRRALSPPRIKVLDSIHENGMKLVEMTDDDLVKMKTASPGLRIVPEVKFFPARAPRITILAPKVGVARAKAAKTRRVLKVVTSDGKPLADAEVVAFTDWEKQEGAEGTTKANGEVSLALPKATKKLEKVVIYAAHTGWPMVRANVKLDGSALKIPLIAIDFADARTKAYAPFKPADGKGVKVGILDTGCGPHKWLKLDKAVSAVTVDSDAKAHDTDGHGTHVAGVIAARGEGFTGNAASVRLNIYRVFPRDGSGASNFDIAKAIDMAVEDGCDLINMSLSGGPMDAVTDEAIKAARAKGTVCVIAAGNEGGPVGNPARHSLAICVSAMGYKGLWPKGATQQMDLTKPLGKQGAFIGGFSNTGPEVDLTGTGCGIISTYPQDRFAIMDGTSMACPCTTGAIARLLAKAPQVLKAKRDAARSDQIVQLALTHARDMGFPGPKQGAGLCE